MKKLLMILVMLFVPALVSAESLFIMGWDGAGWNNVERMLKAGELPNLEWLIKDTGRYPFPIDTHGRTSTTNSWTRIFTGLDPDQTGVSGNIPLKHIDINVINPESLVCDQYSWSKSAGM